ncbi:MAG: ABC transporter permease, partial [Longimicrobiales bacterium]
MWTAARRLTSRISAVARAGRLDNDFEQELDSHVAMLSDELVRRGMPAEQARRAARIRVGGAESLKERHRDARGLPAVEGLWRDLLFAWRRLIKEPWFSAAAIVALALGIGANATGFTIVNAAFLRGLPFDEAGRLYLLTWQIRPGRSADVSYPELLDWRAGSESFELAAFSEVSVTLADDRAAPQQLFATRVTANTFGVLREQPILGRDLTSEDEQPGAVPVMLIGDEMWAARYDRDPAVLGRVVRLDGQPATIVGVMPPGLEFPDRTAAWVPFVPTEHERRRSSRSVAVLARLRDGVDARQARAEFERIGQRLMAAYPAETAGLSGIVVETLTEAFVGDGARSMFMAVMTGVGLVLLIACANVANLLLSRSAARAREIALRMSVGATRWRVVRQLLIESILLAALGGAGGLLLAGVAVDLFEAGMQDSGKPYWMVFTIAPDVVAYVAALCVITAVLFGLAPALHVSRTNNYTVLKEGGRGTTGSSRLRRFGSAMVIVEIALTIVLLGGAGMMLRSFLTLYAIEPGIDTDRLLAMQIELPETKYPTAEARRGFFDRLQPRFAAIAGIEQAAITTGVPPFDGGERLVEVEMRSTSAARPRFVSTVTVTPEFFGVVNRPVIRGRGFEDRDGSPGQETVIVNQRLADELFGDVDPIGRRLRFT